MLIFWEQCSGGNVEETHQGVQKWVNKAVCVLQFDGGVLCGVCQLYELVQTPYILPRAGGIWQQKVFTQTLVCHSHSLRWRLSLLRERMPQRRGLTRSICLEMETRPSLCHRLMSFIPNRHSDQSLLSPEAVNWNLEKRVWRREGFCVAAVQRHKIQARYQKALSCPNRYCSRHLKAKAFTPTEPL